MPIWYQGTCNFCGRDYNGQGKFFCSMRCSARHHALEIKKKDKLQAKKMSGTKFLYVESK